MSPPLSHGANTTNKQQHKATTQKQEINNKQTTTNNNNFVCSGILVQDPLAGMSRKVSLVLILRGLLASSAPPGVPSGPTPTPTGGLPPAKLCKCGTDLAVCGACAAGWAQTGVQSDLNPPIQPQEDGSFNGLFSPVIDSSEDSEVAKVVLSMPQTVRDRSASWTIRDLN